jgi:hypothetical protein
LPTLLCFIFFPTAQNILKFYGSPQTAHLLLPQSQMPTLQAKAKEPFLATAPILIPIFTTYLLLKNE